MGAETGERWTERERERIGRRVLVHHSAPESLIRGQQKPLIFMTGFCAFGGDFTEVPLKHGPAGFVEGFVFFGGLISHSASIEIGWAPKACRLLEIWFRPLEAAKRASKRICLFCSMTFSAVLEQLYRI